MWDLFSNFGIVEVYYFNYKIQGSQSLKLLVEVHVHRKDGVNVGGNHNSVLHAQLLP